MANLDSAQMLKAGEGIAVTIKARTHAAEALQPAPSPEAVWDLWPQSPAAF